MYIFWAFRKHLHFDFGYPQWLRTSSAKKVEKVSSKFSHILYLCTIWPFAMRLEPVSYTHLDVYKRQVMTLFAERAIHVRFQRTVEAFHNGSLFLTVRGIECDTISAQQFFYGTVVVLFPVVRLQIFHFISTQNRFQSSCDLYTRLRFQWNGVRVLAKRVNHRHKVLESLVRLCVRYHLYQVCLVQVVKSL